MSVTTVDNIYQPGKDVTLGSGHVIITGNVTCARLLAPHGTFLELNGVLEMDELLLVGMTGYDGLHFAGVSGHIGHIDSSAVQGDTAKFGKGCHDLLIESWKLRTTNDHVRNRHKDGLQVMSAHRITIGEMDCLSTSINNAGLFCNPINGDPGKSGADNSLITDVTINGGSIIVPNAGIRLGYCTGCGARNTTLKAKQPFAGLGPDGVCAKPIDSGNTKIDTNPR